MEVNVSLPTVVPTTFEIPDTELLQAWVRDQRQTDFTEIVRRHLGLVRGIARRQVGADLADDIAQMVFAILARKASGLAEVRSLGSWLHRVTMLQCRGIIRRQIRDRRSHQSAMESFRLANARDPLADVLPYLDSAICDLPDSDRELIHLRYSERLTFPEMARRTGRSESALRQQAGRALEKLAGILRRRGVGIPVATLAAGLGTTLTGTSSASAAGAISTAAIAATSGGGPWSIRIFFLIMNTKKSLLVVGLVAVLSLVGVWKSRKNRDLTESDAGSSITSPRSGLSTSDTDSAPAKTKVGRSRAPIPPTPEEVAAAAKMRELHVRMVDHARMIGIAMFEFETQYGSFPSEETATAVKKRTGTKADLKAATANDCFFQLIASGMMPNDERFSQEEPELGQENQPKPMIQLEKCAFSFLSGMSSAGNPRRPLVVFPMVPGTGLFDRKVLGGKAVILRADNSVTSVPIAQDGTAIENGMDIFDPAQPFWNGKVPPIRWPEK